MFRSCHCILMPFPLRVVLNKSHHTHCGCSVECFVSSVALALQSRCGYFVLCTSKLIRGAVMKIYFQKHYFQVFKQCAEVPIENVDYTHTCTLLAIMIRHLSLVGCNNGCVESLWPPVFCMNPIASHPPNKRRTSCSLPQRRHQCSNFQTFSSCQSIGHVMFHLLKLGT